ncbi:hypothetical protein [Pseudomonas sp. TWI929]
MCEQFWRLFVQAVVVLQNSAQKVRVDAGKLEKLVRQFEISGDGDRAVQA